MPDMPRWIERYVLLYFSGADGRARVPEVFPAHHAADDPFVTDGVVESLTVRSRLASVK